MPDPREFRLDSLSTWLTIWATLVFLGVAVELLEDGPEVWKILKNLRKPDWVDNKRIWRWQFSRKDAKKVIAVIGTGIVAAGIAGELYVGAESSRIEHEIRTDLTN
jgi:hypothetical protein